MDYAGWICDITVDEDGDGNADYADNDEDCDDDDGDGSYLVGLAYMETDLDGDGIDDCSTDTDGDGYAFEGTDCDDEDEYTYPGAGFMEAAPLDEECLTDEDGDGYAYSPYPGVIFECFTIEMTDSYGDGWNGNTFDLYVDGVYEESFTNQNLTSGVGVETETDEFCVENGSTFSFLYTAGSYPSEVSGTLTSQETGLSVSYQGSSYPSTITVSWSTGDMAYLDGEEIMYPLPANGTSSVGGTDSDDSNASVH